MTSRTPGPIGFALDVAADDAHLDVAAELEELGCSAIWLPGGQLDRLDRVADLVRATAAVPIATGIVAPDVHAASELAAMYAAVEVEAPRRFLVGLGAPQQQRALRRLGDYLDQLDAADPPVPRQRRLLAALGPRKLELARQRCGGAVALLVTPAFTTSARRILGPDAVLVIDQMVVVDRDPARARETARAPLRFLSGVRGYPENFARMGFRESEIVDLHDHLVDELVTWGDLDAIAARVAEHHAAGADQVVLTVLAEGRQPTAIEVARELAARGLM